MALSLSATSFAFAPAMPVIHSSAARNAPAVQMGYSWSQPGEGAVWDPLRLASTPERFERLRYVEVKHGRIAMLAFVGYLTTAAGARIPGELANGVKMSDISGSGFAALQQCSFSDIATIFLSIGFLEINVMKERVKGEFPGDLRNGLFKEGWDMYSDADKERKKNIELNNGRGAMMGIFGLMCHEGVGVDPIIGTGVDWRLTDITATWMAAGSGA